MDINNSNLRARPTPSLSMVRENLGKIDAELSRCYQKVEILKQKQLADSTPHQRQRLCTT